MSKKILVVIMVVLIAALSAILIISIKGSVQSITPETDTESLESEIEQENDVDSVAESADEELQISSEAESQETESLNEESDAADEETAEETRVEDLPWNLRLVNREYTLSESFEPELGSLSNDYQVDARIVDAAEAMIQGAADAGYTIYCTSGYRDYYLQWTLLENKIYRVQNETGLSGEDAFDEAKTVVALPGTSEHQTGLAMDLLCGSYSSLDEGIEDTPEIQWCLEHCAEYGFILRYPKDQMDISGIVYEPWHFRYVGVEAATEIMDRGIVLETYLEEKYGIECQTYDFDD